MKALVDRIDRANREIRQALFWAVLDIFLIFVTSPQTNNPLSVLVVLLGFVSLFFISIWGWHNLDELNDSIRALKSQGDKAETNR